MLGTLTTVAVAWGISLWHIVHWEKVVAAGVTESDAPCWMVYRYQRAGFEWMEGQAIWSSGNFWFSKGRFADSADPLRCVFDERPVDPMPQWTRRIVTARGWPFLALWCQVEREPHPQGWMIKRIRGGLTESSVFRTKWIGPEIPMLPTRPLLLGLAADVLIYAAGWWIFWILARATVGALGLSGAIMRTTVALCAGCAATVAVTWTCAAVVVLDQSNQGPQTVAYDAASSGSSSVVFLRHPGALQAQCDLVQFNQPSQIRRATWTGLPMRENYMVDGDTIAPAWLSLPRSSRLGSSQGIAVADARGWPMIAMMSTYELRATPTTAITTNVCGGMTFRARFAAGPSRDALVLPLRPVWPGFAANTLVFTAACWMLFVAPLVLRKALRSKHGLCPVCGYDLRGRANTTGSNVCPECGTAASAMPDSRKPTAESPP